MALADVLSDLVICCCDAPSAAQRAQADALLYELVTTRLQNTTMSYDFSRFCPGNGGPDRANLFFFALRTPAANRAAFAPVAGERDAVPAGASDAASAAVSAVLNDGGTLVTAVRAATGTAFYASRRRVNSQRVAPGSLLTLWPCMEMLAAPSDGSFSFAAGTYTVQLAATIAVDDTANPAPFSFDILANGEHALTLSGSRAAVDQYGVLFPAGDARLGSTIFATLTGAITLASTSAITLANSGSYGQSAIGLLRVF
ncbi:MAG TPA: hypothetical protein VMI54_15795 [Polyangiaceae bacterium]|nr:hypothetical protein [Polyangiaceae bacterium]